MTIAVPNPRVQAILDGLAPVWDPGDVRELRVLHTSKRTVSGYFDEPLAFAQAAAAWNGKAPGVYQTLNPVNPVLLARAQNRVEPFARTTTSDPDIARRCWLPIDCDPIRPADVSSSEEEHDAALQRGVKICRWLIEQDFARDSLLYGSSGNGAHVLVRIDLPNDADTASLVKRCLESLSARFGDDTVAVDVSTFNAARIWKVAGTMACKGDDVAGRPHREARWIQMPDSALVAPVELLHRLADVAPAPVITTAARRVQSEFSLEDFIARHLSHDALPPTPWEGGTRWRLRECVFNPAHTDGSAALFQLASGAIAYRCLHNGCADRTWSDVRALFEPKTVRTDLEPVHVSTPPPTNGNGHTPPTEIERESFPLTDMGNAERLVARHGRDVRYVKLWDRWMIWVGTHWKDDITNQIGQRVKDTVRSIYAEAAALEEGERRQQVWNHAVRSENGSRIREMLRLARDEEKDLAAEPSMFDTDPMLLTATNGTVDLRTGSLRAHRREDYIRKSLRVQYNPSARAPLWERCLEDWMDGKRELIEYLQRAVGYSLTGSTGEEVLFLLYGLGRNGKTKFLNAIRHMLADYAQTLRAEALMVKPGSDIPNEIAALVGARMVTTVEISEGARLAESLVKQLTGGDYISARFMRAEFFEFKPAMKIWMATNHAPRVTDTTDAMWERIHLVPFEITIPAEQRDHRLQEKLEAEAEGILTWAVEGCLKWQQHGLAPPERVKAATRSYRTEMDTLGQFLEDCCAQGEGYQIAKGALFARYEAWCDVNGEKRWSQQALGRKLRERGFDEYRNGTGRFWLGLSVIPEQTS